MNEFINRIVTAWRALVVKRIMFIEISHDKKKGQDRVELWTTESDTILQAQTLRRLAESLEYDVQEQERKNRLHSHHKKNGKPWQ